MLYFTFIIQLGTYMYISFIEIERICRCIRIILCIGKLDSLVLYIYSSVVYNEEQHVNIII